MERTRHLLIAVALLAVSTIVQVVVIGRSTTTGLDTVRFVEYARSIEQRGLVQTARTHRQQPLYPACVWLVHQGLRRAMGEFPSAWATSAQVAAAVPLALAVVPLYFLLLRLVGWAAAAAGSSFFCVLPEVSRLGADGISDSTHLLFFCVALWAMVEYLEGRKVEGGRRKEEQTGGDTVRVRDYRPLWLLLGGGATALAALARAEVLVLAAALGVTLAVFQLLPGRRRPWGHLAVASACFLPGLAVIWAPYLAAVGATAPQAAVARILGRAEVEPETSWSSRPERAPVWRLPDGAPMAFDLKERSVSLRRRGYPAAIVRFGRKLADASGYWIGALALFGAWRLGCAGAARRLGGRAAGGATAGDRFVQVFFALFVVAAVRFSAAEGYLAARHLIPVVVVGLGAAGYGALESAAWIRRLAGGGSRAVGSRSAGWALVAVACLACLPQTFMRLHHSRLGHRAAGQWLAGRTDLPGAVLDTQGWTGLYSGRETYPYTSARWALSDRRLRYLVVEDRELEYTSGRSRTLRWLIAAAAERVAEFPDVARRRPTHQPVTVYRWHADRFHRRIRTVTLGSISTGRGLLRGAYCSTKGDETGIAVSARLGVDSRPALRSCDPRREW